MGKKVLIIEDSGDISPALKLLIEIEGYTPIVALTGFDGRDKAISERPDLILMDIGLPDTDGIRLTRELRSLPETAGTPILWVSSYVGAVDLQAADGGCDEMFTKTDFIVNYAETIRKYIERD